METAIAIYGAALATAIAIGQAITSWRRRRRVRVTTDIMTSGLDADEHENARGTPIRVQRGDDLLWEEALIHMTVRNEGGSPIQIVAIVLESLGLKADALEILQVTPPPLPHVLDPGTRIELTIQKEPIDMLSNVTFFGVVDALGRRYAPDAENVMRTIQQSWDMPTRVKKYRRRDDPTAPSIRAYQVRDETRIERTDRTDPKAVPLITRPHPLEGET